MPKKKNTPIPKEKPRSQADAVAAPERDMHWPAWLYDFKVQAVIVAVLAFSFYVNTFSHELAVDDTLVIMYNEYVYQGFAGIPGILSSDAYDSYDKFMGVGNQLSGGRYRPLSIVNFAIEQQFLGAVRKEQTDSVMKNANLEGPQKKRLIHDIHVRHRFNVLWYTLSVVVLLYFLRYIVFKNNYIMAFVATVLFAIHPIHSEVVANVKSRDEILSLLFICLTFIFAFKYREQKKTGLLVAALASYFLAFLSKEYAIGLMLLLPLAFYLFNKDTLSKSIVATLPYAGVTVLFLFIRSQVVGFSNDVNSADILNNPYALATGTEHTATIIATSLNYLRLLLFPHPLTSDYSYNTIPYKDFTNPLVWLSLAVHIALFRLFFVYVKQRNVLSFAIAFYLVNMLLVSNLLFNIGATMSERLIYHSSVGFAIAAGYLLYKGMEMIQPVPVAKATLAGCMILLTGLCGFKTIARNKDWKNNYTLFPADLKVSPNSVSLNAFVAAAFVDRSVQEKDTTARNADLHEAVRLFDKAIANDSDYVIAWVNRGVTYYRLGEPDSSYFNLVKAKALLSNHAQLPELFYNNAVLYMDKRQYAKALNSLKISLQLNPGYTRSKTAMDQIVNSGVLQRQLPVQK